jgi:predicted DsbA family dithiol-disulfide isomerase
MKTLHIDIVSDVVCPWCFIGKRHLEAALSQWQAVHADVTVTTRWHPFQLNPDLPGEGVDRKTYLEEKFGGPTRAKEIYARVGAAGSAAGLALNFDAIAKQPNTLAAHALIDFAQTSSDSATTDRVVEALFKAYFVDGQFIGDHKVLLAIASSQGLDADRVRALLADPFALDRIASADANARAQGVSGVPFFVFNQKYALSGAQPVAAMLETMARVGSTSDPIDRSIP